jgi:hypothetical protein
MVEHISLLNSSFGLWQLPKQHNRARCRRPWPRGIWTAKAVWAMSAARACRCAFLARAKSDGTVPFEAGIYFFVAVRKTVGNWQKTTCQLLISLSQCGLVVFIATEAIESAQNGETR